MSRGPVTFKQRDVTAALKAAKAAGLEVAKVEVDPITGRIVITTNAGGDKEPTTDLDRWLIKHADTAERA
jgi:hypothetical protein